MSVLTVYKNLLWLTAYLNCVQGLDFAAWQFASTSLWMYAQTSVKKWQYADNTVYAKSSLMLHVYEGQALEINSFHE